MRAPRTYHRQSWRPPCVSALATLSALRRGADAAAEGTGVGDARDEPQEPAIGGPPRAEAEAAAEGQPSPQSALADYEIRVAAAATGAGAGAGWRVRLPRSPGPGTSGHVGGDATAAATAAREALTAQFASVAWLSRRGRRVLSLTVAPRGGGTGRAVPIEEWVRAASAEWRERTGRPRLALQSDSPWRCVAGDDPWHRGVPLSALFPAALRSYDPAAAAALCEIARGALRHVESLAAPGSARPGVKRARETPASPMLPPSPPPPPPPKRAAPESVAAVAARKQVLCEGDPGAAPPGSAPAAGPDATLKLIADTVARVMVGRAVVRDRKAYREPGAEAEFAGLAVGVVTRAQIVAFGRGFRVELAVCSRAPLLAEAVRPAGLAREDAPGSARFYVGAMHAWVHFQAILMQMVVLRGGLRSEARATVSESAWDVLALCRRVNSLPFLRVMDAANLAPLARLVDPRIRNVPPVSDWDRTRFRERVADWARAFADRSREFECAVGGVNLPITEGDPRVSALPGHTEMVRAYQRWCDREGFSPSRRTELLTPSPGPREEPPVEVLSHPPPPVPSPPPPPPHAVASPVLSGPEFDRALRAAGPSAARQMLDWLEFRRLQLRSLPLSPEVTRELVEREYQVVMVGHRLEQLAEESAERAPGSRGDSASQDGESAARLSASASEGSPSPPPPLRRA